MTAFNDLPLILDGATGTQLQKNGLPSGACVEKWALDNPDTIKKIQRSYVDAGSQAVYAPTFGANRLGLKKHGIIGESVRDICRRLVELSKDAVNGRALVGGDIAPTGLQLAPIGTVSFDELLDIFTEQAAALEDAGVDFFGIETQMSLAEARAAVLAVKSVSNKPIAVSFSCGSTGKTLFGGDLTAALLSLSDLGISAYGINCSGDLKLITGLLKAMKPYSDIPLIAKPNAGLPEIIKGAMVYNLSPEDLASEVPAFVAAGARLIGGCCGTDERHIAEIKRAMEPLHYPDLTASTGEAYSSESRVVDFSGETQVSEIQLSDDIMEDAAAAEAMGAEVLKVALREKEDIDIIEEYQYSIRAPLMVECRDSELLEGFLRIYNGKPKILN
jgi:5-methyltetrahydrofolate--homocysteine methyltransferase